MKKLITLAVAAAMVAPLAASAETTLYGRLDTALVNVDDGTDSAWDIETGTTRVGLKGSEDLGNGLKAIFQAEWQFTSSEGGSTNPADLVNRLGYAGLSGGFGTVAIGRQWTPYYGAVNKTDIFNNPGNAGTGPNISSSNGHSMGPSRTGNALAYVSPNFNGFQAKLALVIDRALGGTGANSSESIDAYNPSIEYNNGPISVGASFMGWDNNIAASDIWGIGGSYNLGMFKVIAQYEDRDDVNGTAAGAADSWAVGGEAYFGNNTVRAVYGQMDPDGGNELDVWAVGFQHNLSKATRVYVEYNSNDDDTVGGTDTNEFALGFRHDF